MLFASVPNLWIVLSCLCQYCSGSNKSFHGRGASSTKHTVLANGLKRKRFPSCSQGSYHLCLAYINSGRLRKFNIARSSQILSWISQRAHNAKHWKCLQTYTMPETLQRANLAGEWVTEGLKIRLYSDLLKASVNPSWTLSLPPGKGTCTIAVFIKCQFYVWHCEPHRWFVTNIKSRRLKPIWHLSDL